MADLLISMRVRFCRPRRALEPPGLELEDADLDALLVASTFAET